MWDCGVEIRVKNMPSLDPGYLPAYGFVKGYQSGASLPYAIGLERENGNVSCFDTVIRGGTESIGADLFYISYLTKLMLYAWGGWKVYLCGDSTLSAQVRDAFLQDPRHDMARCIVQKTYGHALAFELLPYAQCPPVKEGSKAIGRHLEGYRIGFDAGGSDRKVSAVANGQVLYSEEVEWIPKLTTDLAYHYQGIVEAFHTAASKMPQVDAIGVSTAGIVVDNQVMSSTLFQRVPQDIFKKQGRDIYLRAAKEIGDVPLVVQNDGDVSALAGSMSLEDNRVLGIAMGTSEAAGYVDARGNLTGWLNELASVVVDLQESAPFDETAQDVGVGASYFSQDCVIRLAAAAGIPLDETLLPAQKLKVVQELMEKEDPRAKEIFENIGCYFAHSLALYALFYDIKHVLLLGRVTSGRGGDVLLSQCQRILREEYPALWECISIWLPDEKIRRVGQSVAAASLAGI